jgi:hypothetical protein
LVHTILWKYKSIFDGCLFHLRAKCLSSLTPIVIFKIDIDEMCIVRFVACDKCLHSILLMKVELKYIFSFFLYLGLSFLFFLYKSSTVLFALMVHSVTTIAAAAWLTQWVYVLHWVTKNEVKLNTRPLPTVDEKKSIDTWYHTTLILCSFNIYTHTLAYANMLTIYLRNHSSKTVIEVTEEIITRSYLIRINKFLHHSCCYLLILSLYDILVMNIKKDNIYHRLFFEDCQKKMSVFPIELQDEVYLLFKKEIIVTNRFLFPNCLLYRQTHIR